MTSFDFEGRPIPIEPGDTIAAALYRSGVRVFSRSFKYHRPRGLYCGTGDCPNCSMTVDGEPAVRTCVTPATAEQHVRRSTGWPSAEWDVFGALWWLRPLLPVGFHYKWMHKPAGLWAVAEGLIRKLAGLGEVPLDQPPGKRERRYHHPGVCVVGAGLAGLSAALAAAEQGERVVLCDEGGVGVKLPPGPLATRVAGLAREVRGNPRVLLLECATAIGVYEGPLVPIVAADALHLVLPKRVIVATGAVERHAGFEGDDLPGVWLARGAALAGARFGLTLGRAAVVAVETEAGLDSLDAMRRAGVPVRAVLVPAQLASRVAAGVSVVPDSRVVKAEGRGSVRAVIVDGPGGRKRISCDTLVLALGLVPRDNLARQARAASVEVAVAGDVASVGEIPAAALPSTPTGGFVCLCEDVTAADLDLAWAEGYRGTELLKRYSTATMGPCQGAMCHSHLRSFVAARSLEPMSSEATTARPPSRPVRLEDVAAGARYSLEWHTALHDRHLEMGGIMEWAGIWKRVERYGEALEEYRAVRERVSIMDVSTLGKYRIAGRDATAFLERLYPCHVSDLKPGRSRYALLLNEAGYVFDDGLVGSLGDEGYYCTFTSGGADVMESWLRDWAEAWGHSVRIVNQTNTLGAINVAGPRARDLMVKLTTDAVDPKSIPYGGIGRLTVGGVPCIALRVGFVGELSFELHHPRLESVRLWGALLTAGTEFGIRPHGLEALRLLRLEKGHIIVGQDTDFDSSPAKLGLEWAVKMSKPDFVGRAGLSRLATIEPNRVLRAFTFPGPVAPLEGAQLMVGGERVGYLTSSRFSPTLGYGIALGWVYGTAAGFPSTVKAIDGTGTSLVGTVTTGPFFDPEGTRLRA